MQKSELIKIYSACRGLDRSFSEDFDLNDLAPCVLLRHDVDDDLDKSVRNAELQKEIGVKATYFILNTAPYFDASSAIMWNKIHYIQSLGHEIGWHNNILAQYMDGANAERIKEILGFFSENGINVNGSASHGDPLCRQYGFINYEIFEGCTRSKDPTLPEPKFSWDRIKMQDVGLSWEAYWIKRDVQYSEPGGYWSKGLEPVIDPTKRTMILIHPQHHGL